MIISTKNIFKCCFYFTIIFIMFYKISYGTDNIPDSISKIKKETQLKIIPAIGFANLNNKILDLNKIEKNNLLIINFWALWCAPCVKEMPDLKELSTKLNDSIILFINQDSYKDNQEVETFIEKIGINKNNILIDSKMESNQLFLLRGIPTTLIINKKGKVLWRIEGVIDWTNENLIEWLKKGAPKN